MGLYLCVFDGEEELEGVDVGSYEDFGYFRKLIEQRLEGGQGGSKFPVLMLHSDCDGEWTVEEASRLADEIREISKGLEQLAPAEPPPGSWQKALMKQLGLQPRNLAECFIDVDGEPLLERITELCEVAQRSGQPILFQ